MKKFLGSFILSLGLVSTANAYPDLMLDIAGGSYDTSTQTIVSNGSSFTLYAYLTNPSLINDTYYISAAIFPQISVNKSIGSFSFQNHTVSATGGMVYGTPPIGDTDNKDDLQSHGIFRTYYSEFVFSFNSDTQTSPYNTQDYPGGPVAPGTGMYYKAFTVDTSGLDTDYIIHFDLFSTTSDSYEMKKENCIEWITKPNGQQRCETYEVINIADMDIKNFAPFSHDAQSSPPNNDPSVPEPTTMLLFGTGLIGLAGLARRKNS